MRMVSQAGKLVDDAYIKQLDEAVHLARANKKWMREYMTLMMRDLENRELGREEGREVERREKIADMLKKGRQPQVIADFCDYPINLVMEVKNGLSLLPTKQGKRNVMVY